MKFVMGTCLVLFISPLWAMEIEIPSSFNPVGSGARALGMGGAFIAISDDATAASWNPGGLIQLEKPEVSLVFNYTNRKENTTYFDHPEASGKQAVNIRSLNYFSAAYPFTFKRRDMIVSLNYQHLYDFNRNWDYSFYNPESVIYEGYQDIDYKQDGALYALGFAFCAEIIPNFSAGVTFNYWGDFFYDNQWEQTYHFEANKKDIETGEPTGKFVSNKKEVFSFSGWNVNIGFLWRISEYWTLGGVFKTPFTADVEHSFTREDNEYFQNPATRTDDYELKMPMSYGIGIAYRFSDYFTMSGDIYRTHWEDFEYVGWDGKKTFPITGKNINNSTVNPTTWFRMGGEYIVSDKKNFIVPICAGIFYDPAPSEGAPDDYYGIAIGTGFACIAAGSPYNRYSFDIAYQFRFGDDVGLTDNSYQYDVREHIVYTSLTVHF